MKKLFEQIATHQSTLSEHPFCRHLREPETIAKASFDFVLKMTFFVLGFRDILDSIRVEKPKNSIEKKLNKHCEEDSEHWRWFIDDLNTLGMNIEYWGGDVSSVLHSLWSRDNYTVRDLVYRVIHHVHASSSVQEKLIIVECLEAAFAVFIENLNPLTKKLGLYGKLRYFGEQHYEQEASHTMGSWLDQKNTVSDTSNIQLDDIRKKQMLSVVDDIFFWI